VLAIRRSGGRVRGPGVGIGEVLLLAYNPIRDTDPDGAPEREGRVGTLLHFFGSDNYATSSSNLQALLAVGVIHRRGFVLACWMCLLDSLERSGAERARPTVSGARKERGFASCAGRGGLAAARYVKWDRCPRPVKPNSSYFSTPQCVPHAGAWLIRMVISARGGYSVPTGRPHCIDDVDGGPWGAVKLG
jgi:hypothetical protein